MHGELRNEGKRPLWRLGLDWRTIETDLKKSEWREWTGLGLAVRSYERGNKPSGFIHGGVSLD
jgi:hypothetical protein